MPLRPRVSSFSPRPNAPDGQGEIERSRARNLSPRIAKHREHFAYSYSLLLSHPIDAWKKKLNLLLLQPLLLSAADVAEAPVAALATAPARSVVQLYRSSTPSATNAEKALSLAEKARAEVSPSIASVEIETCFNVGLGEAAPLGKRRAATLAWLLAETFEPEALSPESSFGSSGR